MKILGIDEAGRGPVIGSMFVGGFMIKDSENKYLEEIGVKDSKKLSDSRREKISGKLENIGKSYVKEITASEIDELREVMTLNEIELKGFAEVIRKFDPEKIIVDLPEPDGKRFSSKIKKELPPSFQDIEIIAEHGADDNYPVVSAASIMAKSAREEHIKKLHSKYGYDFKSGYPHDTETREFLKEYLKDHEELPPETRLSWSTAEKIKKEFDQTSFSDF